MDIRDSGDGIRIGIQRLKYGSLLDLSSQWGRVNNHISLNRFEGYLLSFVIVDIDDTVLDTTRRMQAIWREVLGREVPIEIIESMGLRQIFEAYATPHQLERVREHQTRFFRLLLCEEDLGFEFARLDEAIPYAAETINAWARDSHVVYLTGRTENTRNQTLEALRLHGFPSGDSDLFMVSAEDWSSGRAVEARQACCLM
jgi:beta-phosphoglucomutase-like phosphatase (HAD superfamily)